MTAKPFIWMVDVAASTETHWKLAVGMKEKFEDNSRNVPNYLRDTKKLANYSEATEGWVVKRHEGRNTLVCLACCFLLQTQC